MEIKGKNGLAKVFTDNIDQGAVEQIEKMLDNAITEPNSSTDYAGCTLRKRRDNRYHDSIARKSEGLEDLSECCGR